MSYSPPFSTQNADYVLAYAVHDRSISEDIFEKGRIESLDAIVLENSGREFKDLANPDVSMEPEQYNLILASAHATGKPIYLTDVDVTPMAAIMSDVMTVVPFVMGVYCILDSISDAKKRKEKSLNRRDFLRIAGKGAVGTFFAGSFLSAVALAYTKGESNGVLPAISASGTNVLPTSVCLLRNAITAKKTEEYLAPLLQQRLDKKPKIALVFGAWHAGIEGCIKHKWWRKIVLDFFNGSGVKTEQLNSIYEAIPEEEWRETSTMLLGSPWNVTEYNCRLF